MPGADKDIVGKVVEYLRQNNGTAILNGHKLAKEWGFSQTQVNYAIRKLSFCIIIMALDKCGSGHRNPTFALCERFRDGEEWRDILQDNASMFDAKNQTILNNEGRPDVIIKIMDHPRIHNGRVAISATALAKEWGFSSSAISKALKRLINDGSIAATSLSGRGIRNPEFKLTEKGRAVAIEATEKDVSKVVSKKRADSRPSLPTNTRLEDNDVALKLSLSRELVQVYERLKEAQDLNVELQAKNRTLEVEKVALESRISELSGELDEERASHRSDVNEIATLELQLRNLRSETDPKARRIRFDRSGFQA